MSRQGAAEGRGVPGAERRAGGARVEAARRRRPGCSSSGISGGAFLRDSARLLAASRRRGAGGYGKRHSSTLGGPCGGRCALTGSQGWVDRAAERQAGWGVGSGVGVAPPATSTCGPRSAAAPSHRWGAAAAGRSSAWCGCPRLCAPLAWGRAVPRGRVWAAGGPARAHARSSSGPRRGLAERSSCVQALPARKSSGCSRSPGALELRLLQRLRRVGCLSPENGPCRAFQVFKQCHGP